MAFDNRNRGISVLPALPYNLAYTQGQIYHVKPYSGSDSNDGLTVDSSLKTLAQAQTLATANQNDIVLLYAESNSAANTTDYQSSTLAWAKDGVHLIGVGPGNVMGSRCRVALTSAYNTASHLFELSADNCYISGIQFYEGVAGTNPTGCMYMTGSHNHLKGCHIAGMGSSGNVVANAFSLSMVGSSENLFDECIIGYTTHRGAQETAEIYMAASGGSGTGCGKNTFRNCTILMGNSTSATNASFLRIGQHGNAAFVLFDRCKFLNTGAGDGGLAITYAITINADPEGTVLLDYCSSAGVTDWSDNSGFIWGPLFSTTADGGVGAVLVK
jgi:hypothetical protein